MSHNDRWICAAAIRTRATLITQDSGMVEQLDQFFHSLDMLELLRTHIRVVYVPRTPEALAEASADDALDKLRMNDQIKHLLSQLDPREAEVLKLRLGLDRGEPRTQQEVAEHFGLTPARISQIEKNAFAKLRAAGD